MACMQALAKVEVELINLDLCAGSSDFLFKSGRPRSTGFFICTSLGKKKEKKTSQLY